MHIRINTSNEKSSLNIPEIDVLETAAERVSALNIVLENLYVVIGGERPTKTKDIEESVLAMEVLRLSNEIEVNNNLRTGSSVDIVRIVTIDPVFFGAERLKSMVAENVDFGIVLKFLIGKLGISETDMLYDLLYSIECKTNPSSDRDTFEDLLYAAKAKTK